MHIHVENWTEFPLFKFPFILDPNLLRYVVLGIMMINVPLNINGS